MINDQSSNPKGVTCESIKEIPSAPIGAKLPGLENVVTPTAPTNAGDYVVRVSVAEGTNYLAGSETKEFTV